MNKRLLYSLLAILACTNLATIAADDKSALQKPNIIFILSDDVGLGNVHCTGGHYNTPHIDSLASGGIRFENFYAFPLCGPSRCMFLTGRYPFRTGLFSNQSAGVLECRQEIMIPTVMKNSGYATACVGKLGQMPYGPGQWGFDEVMSCQGSGRHRPEQNIDYERNGRPGVTPAGKASKDLTDSSDFFGTFAELGGAQLPRDTTDEDALASMKKLQAVLDSHQSSREPLESRIPTDSFSLIFSVGKIHGCPTKIRAS